MQPTTHTATSVPRQLRYNSRIFHRTSKHTRSANLSAYLASPLGFTESGRFYLNHVLLPFFDRFDRLIVLNPWQYAIEPESDPIAIGARNVEMLSLADFAIAILDGPDVDSGTAAEIGFACANGLPIIGLRHDQRHANDHPHTTINLQVEYFIRYSGGCLVSSLDEMEHILRIWLDQDLTR
ncbi:MAG: hypothetical protein D6690_17965 [Nitrospirae bacterium]|nr:MAG: hypothetical protein D6690_17965 [Nitrospirota bacterium]